MCPDSYLEPKAQILPQESAEKIYGEKTAVPTLPALTMTTQHRPAATLAALLMFQLAAPVLTVNHLHPQEAYKLTKVSCRMLFAGAVANVSAKLAYQALTVLWAWAGGTRNLVCRCQDRD